MATWINIKCILVGHPSVTYLAISVFFHKCIVTSEHLEQDLCLLFPSISVILCRFYLFVVISQQIMLGWTCNFYHSFLRTNTLLCTNDFSKYQRLTISLRYSRTSVSPAKVSLVICAINSHSTH